MESSRFTAPSSPLFAAWCKGVPAWDPTAYKEAWDHKVKDAYISTDMPKKSGKSSLNVYTRQYKTAWVMDHIIRLSTCNISAKALSSLKRPMKQMPNV